MLAKNRLTFCLTAILMGILAIFASQAFAAVPKIIVVGDTPAGTATPNADSSIVDFLTSIYGSAATIQYDAQFYTNAASTRAGGGILGTHPQADIDELNAAALVVISPSVYTSTSYVVSNTNATAIAWNALTVPEIWITSGAFPRATRLSWFNNTSTTNPTLTLTQMTVTPAMASDPLFTGVTITGGMITFTTNASANQMIAVNDIAANFAWTGNNASNTGIAYAWGSDSQPEVVFWAKSATPFFTGCAFNPVGDRWFVNYLNAVGGTGSRTANAIGDLTPDGKQLLQNIITKELPAGPQPTPTPGPTPTPTPTPLPAHVSAPTARVHFPDVHTVVVGGGSIGTVTPSVTTVTLTNTGGSALTLTGSGSNPGLAITGTAASMITFTGTTPATLAVGAQMKVGLQYAPPAGNPEGTFNVADLVITSNADNSPTTVHLVGLSVPVGISRVKVE